MSSKFITDVITGSELIANKNGHVSILITTAITLIPLLVDNVFNDKVYLCPDKNRKFYSIFLMLAPTACVIVLGLILTLQFVRTTEIVNFKEMMKQLIPRVLIVCVVICVTCGSSFIFSQYYICFHMDPKEDSTTHRGNLINESRQIGWIVIISGLLFLFFITIIQFMFFYPTKVEIMWNSLMQFQIKSSEDLLNECLVDLAKKSVNLRLGDISAELKKSSDDDISHIVRLLIAFHHAELEIHEYMDIQKKKVKMFQKSKKMRRLIESTDASITVSVNEASQSK